VSWRKLRTQEERDAAHRANLHSMMISDPGRIDRLAVHLQGVNTARRTLATEAITADHPLRSILFDLHCAIDAIWGAKDETIGPYMRDRLDLVAELGPKARAFVVANAGHWLQYEAPEAFNRAMTEILGLSPELPISREGYERWLS
jgi:2-hydroxy-6-oxonona-2,4-dienedioate hydrolase